jgi:DNA-binding transcriptional LysR family regulator
MARPLPPFDLDMLRTFVAVADNAGFTRAAERVERTQSTVSLQIKKLEDNLGRRVFERSGRALQLTADGEILIGYARRLLQLADEAHLSILESDVGGAVRLGTPEDFATVYLPNILARFSRTHPAVALEVNCNFSAHLLEGFSKGEYDIILLKREPQGPAGGIPVWRDVLVWVTEPKFILNSGQPIPLVLAPAPDIYRKRAISALDAAKMRWRIAYTSTSSEGIHAAVRAGLGVTVLSKGMVPDGLVIVSDQQGLPALPDTEIALYKAPGSLSRAAELLAQDIVQALTGASGS